VSKSDQVEEDVILEGKLATLGRLLIQKLPLNEVSLQIHVATVDPIKNHNLCKVFSDILKVRN
jgi:hypothetical protein